MKKAKKGYRFYIGSPKKVLNDFFFTGKGGLQHSRIAGENLRKNKTGVAKKQHPFPAMPCMKLMKTLRKQGGALSLVYGLPASLASRDKSRGSEEVCTRSSEPELLLFLVGST